MPTQSITGPAAREERKVDRDAWIGNGLAFVAGFVDAAAFIALAGLFTAHVTGNFILIGAALVSASGGIVAKLLALPVFIVAVAATRVIARMLAGRRLPVLRCLLGVEALIVVGFGTAGLILSPLGSPDSPAAVLVGMLGVAAMGVQNAIGRLALSHLAATTVMTVNVTQTVLDAVDLALGEAGAANLKGRLQRMLPAVAFFAVGALAGAFGVAAGSFWCLAIPALALAGLMLVADAA